jgi:hypothetical protein
MKIEGGGYQFENRASLSYIKKPSTSKIGGW